MKRFGWTLLLVAIPVFAGCNGGGTAKNEGSTPNQAQVASGANITQAAEVVAQFLDSFRKGDETTAGRLLTQAAIAEIKKNGLEISPPGSPDSSYKLGRTEYTDEDKDTAYVEVEWTETIEGSAEKKIYETLFAVRLENNQWRIAGMVIETDPNVAPEVIDFENISQNLSQELAPGATQPAGQAQAQGTVLNAPQQPLQGAPGSVQVNPSLMPNNGLQQGGFQAPANAGLTNGTGQPGGFQPLNAPQTNPQQSTAPQLAMPPGGFQQPLRK
ncbi:MAG: hypothetical protein U0905_20335 [Pirellulales bacterium]